jgi:hypothetical protein
LHAIEARIQASRVDEFKKTRLDLPGEGQTKESPERDPFTGC